METFIPKGDFQGFISHLSGNYRVVAPVKKGKSFVFSDISDPADAVIEYNSTILPPKKFFLPTVEQLLHFDRESGQAVPAEVELKDTVFLGVHSYDMQGVLRLDSVMIEGNPDKTYLQRRRHAIFIGTSFIPDQQHFSESVGISPLDTTGFDAFLYPTELGYALVTLTERGEAAAKGYEGKPLKESGDRLKQQPFLNKVMLDVDRIPGALDKVYSDPLWLEYAQKCLSCGSCNVVCPTCYCFDVEDEVALNLKDGTRQRMWDSCQLTTFAEVAGGENFREKREGRLRHRVYRKFRYMARKFPKPMCVGCGRCNRACVAGINIVDVLNRAAHVAI